jgi:hypothetical protein
MTLSRWLLACALSILAAGCTQSVPDQIDEADKMLRSDLPLPESSRQETQALLDEARRLMDAGDAEAAADAAGKALALLRRAKDAALLNKSDG